MIYFVTGGVSPIGRFLLPRLLERGGTVYMLVAEDALDELSRMRALIEADEGELIPVVGDLGKIRLGVSQRIQGQLKHKLDHFFHLATDFDFGADGRLQSRNNLAGVRRALGLAESLHAGCFHLLSSVAAVGRFAGLADEDTCASASAGGGAYHENYHNAERLVRASTLRWRIYRPGVVVGDSLDGVISKPVGPYYFFELLRGLGESLPDWGRVMIPQGGELNLVPVDYVAEAMEHLAHLRQGDNECFLLTHPEGTSVGQVVRLLLGLAGGPRLSVWPGSLPLAGGLLSALAPGAPGYALMERLLAPFGVPVEALELAGSPTRYDSSKSQQLLEPAAIHCPEFDEYAEVVWRYWIDQFGSANRRAAFGARLLDALAGRRNARALARWAKGRVVVIGGAGPGIARECAVKLGRAGATLVLTGTGKRSLRTEADRLQRDGVRPRFYVCNPVDRKDCDRVANKIHKRFGRVDALLNFSVQMPLSTAAGVSEAANGKVQSDHDATEDASVAEGSVFERHLGALQLISALSPAMVIRGQGHIVNIATAGGPRGGAAPLLPEPLASLVGRYTADALGRLLALELAGCGVRFQHLSLKVRDSGESSSQKRFGFPLDHSADDAAERVLKLLTGRPAPLAGFTAATGGLLRTVAPGLGGYGISGVPPADEGCNPALTALPAAPAAGDQRPAADAAALDALLSGSVAGNALSASALPG